MVLADYGEGGWLAVADGVTDGDGRLRFPDAVPAGTYRLTFGTGSYFAARGVEAFYPEVAVTFLTSGGHYHVPAREHVRQRLRLHVARALHAQRCHPRRQARAHAQARKCFP